jgi:hypothetical protein
LSSSDLRVHIGGFGETEWYFNISYDLAAFMESFPDLMRALASGRQFELDLYPQGLERTLVFRPGPRETEILCVSRTSWKPDPDHEFISSQALEHMLVNLGTDFVRALEAVDEHLSKHRTLRPLERTGFPLTQRPAMTETYFSVASERFLSQPWPCRDDSDDPSLIQLSNH